MGNENNIKLNGYKIAHLFKNIRKLNGGKNLLARKLGISTPTLDEYLAQGQELLDRFDEQLQPIYEIDIDGLDEEIALTKGNYINEFLALEGANAISDKNRNAFEVYFLNKKENLKENFIYNFQKEIIYNIKWCEDEKELEKIRLLMLFKLIYDRGQMSLDEELLYLKNRYAKTSSKHVSIVVKDLEKRNTEDFGETKQEQKSITVNQQFNNFTHFSIEMDKKLGRLKKNEAPQISDDIIEAEKIEDD